MIVRDLFYNTPARRKFLKTDRAEGAACAAAALRCALGRPDVSVRCIRDGEELFFSPGDNKLDSCVYSLLGRELPGAAAARSSISSATAAGSDPPRCRLRSSRPTATRCSWGGFPRACCMWSSAARPWT